MKTKYLIFFLLVAVTGCKPKQKIDEEAIAKQAHVIERNPVDVMLLQQRVFKKELVSNGKLEALKRSSLKFRTGAELAYLPVKNGDWVKKGQLIARLTQFGQKQQLENARLQQQKAEVEMKDFLMMRGYNTENYDEIPDEILNTAKIRSGILDAESKLLTAQYEYEATILNAPFSGKVANVKYKAYEMVSPGEEFCTLINDKSFHVEFSVMETELKEINLGKEIKIIPFSMDEPVRGVITEINPIVEENGLVKVKARVHNPDNLLDGMNVKVLIENAVSNKLVVPKSAVLLRQNQEVLFLYKNGTAYWTYVMIELENSDSYAVVANADRGATLEPGDTLIISGNLNLAHESMVEIK